MNSDVRYEGVVYHVQTEDMGLEAAEIVSVVFVDGRVVRSIRKGYDDLEEAGAPLVRERLLDQHRTVVLAILRGRFPGAGDASPRPVEEEGPSFVVTPLVDPRAGEHVSLLLLLRGERSFNPLSGGLVEVTFVGNGDEHEPIYRGTTDVKGFHLAEFKLPPAEGPDLSLIVEGETGNGRVQATLPVLSSTFDWQQPPRQLLDKPRLVVSDLGDPRAGESTSLMVLFRAEPSCRPIADATVRLLLLDGEGEPEEIYRATTDAKGFHRVDVAVPDCESDAASLILEAESPFGPAETVIPISND
jgi:hypothetical protein